MAKGFWEWVFKVLSVLVIPLIVWGVSLEVRLAVQTSEMKQLQKTADALEKVKDGLSNNTNALVRLEEKFNGIDKNVAEVKALINARFR